MEFLTQVRWSPYIVGIGIGVLSWLSFLVSRKPIACSTSFAKLSGLLEKACRGKKAEERPYYQKLKLTVDWQMMLVTGIIFGSTLSALLSGDFHWEWVPAGWGKAFGASPLLRVFVALLGGVVIGFGSRWADGCTSGHGISGTLQLAVSSWVSVVFFFVGGILTTRLIFRFVP